MNQHKYIRFKGDYSKLKSMGYEFQRLFARNYMQWHNNETRIWKKGADVTIERVLNHSGAFLELYLRHRKAEPWTTPGVFGGVYLRTVVNRDNGEVSFDYSGYLQQERVQLASGEYNHTYECVHFTPKLLEPLDTLIDLNWVEVAERSVP